MPEIWQWHQNTFSDNDDIDFKYILCNNAWSDTFFKNFHDRREIINLITPIAKTDTNIKFENLQLINIYGRNWFTLKMKLIVLFSMCASCTDAIQILRGDLIRKNSLDELDLPDPKIAPLTPDQLREMWDDLQTTFSKSFLIFY